MKRVVLSLMVVLGLLAVPAVAQYEQTTPPEQTAPTGETVQEERTDPSADSIAPNSGLTLSGTVVSWNDQQLALQTTTGVEHFQLQQNTVRPSTFTVGESVTVDYTRTSQGVMIASQIRPSGASSTTSTTTGTVTQSQTLAPAPAPAPMAETKIGDGIDQESELEQDVEEAVDDVGDAADEVGAELSEIDDAIEEEVDEAAADTSMDDDDELPATGGKAPLAALLGLLAIGAAAVLRRL